MTITTTSPTATEARTASPDAGTDIIDTASVDQGGGEIHSCSYLRATAAHRCRRREACGVEAGAADDFACQGVFICASDYDQSCTRNADCVAVEEGNTCTEGECQSCFPHTAINQRSLDHYRADIAAAIAAGNRIHWTQCPCPSSPTPLCCWGERCAVGGRGRSCAE